MNHALDALYWKLTQAHTRALASLLFAPALWQTGCEMPVRLLVGERGFRELLQWDKENFIPDSVHSPILGRYAENLLAFWFQHAPHTRLIAHNLAMISPETGQTLGALDFLVEIHQHIYHIELCAKYYGGNGEPEHMVGLNPHDKLMNKFNKFAQQLALPHSEMGQMILRQYQYDLNNQKIQSVSINRGMAFTDLGVLPTQNIYTLNAWTGKLGFPNENHRTAQSRLYFLERNQYLAPARIAIEHTQSWQSMDIKIKNKNENENPIPSGLWAEVGLRPDGFYHEIQRFMII